MDFSAELEHLSTILCDAADNLVALWRCGLVCIRTFEKIAFLHGDYFCADGGLKQRTRQQKVNPLTDHAHSHDEDGEEAVPVEVRRKKFIATMIGCIGIVYGDIGTSPLYAFREATAQIAKDGLHAQEVYGILSLIVWALIIIVTLKYVFILLRADNKGEGGILALTSLVRKVCATSRSKDKVMIIGIIGASLFYADAAITPAISVLSAVEGMKLVTPMFEPYVLAVSIFILILLFMVQKHGTSTVSKFFGPITIVWFLAMAATGTSWIIYKPEVLMSLSPHYAILFLIEHGQMSFMVLGSVFLAVTGAEALYADMGHFGAKPIQRAWIFFIFPCLVLNYMGQGVLVLENHEALENSFFLLAPSWALLPMVILATFATIIAAQAVITGAYSLSRQATQLGFLPRMEIKFTSGENIGEIYMPKVNSILLYGVLLICILFQSSSNMAAAYGIAVTGTMVLTSILMSLVMWKVWKKSLLVIALVVAPLLLIEIVFLGANMMRILSGGFVPVLFGAYMTFLMVVWVYGTRYLAKRGRRRAVRLTDFSENLDQNSPHVIKGTAIFFTSDPMNVPEALIKNIQYNQVIHEHNVIVTVVTSSFPEVPESQRLQIDMVSSKILRVIIHFGFMEIPDVPKALYKASWRGVNIDISRATYFFVRRKIVSDPHRGLPGWMDKFYIALTRFAIGEHDFFKLPRSRVIELGVQMAI